MRRDDVQGRVVTRYVAVTAMYEEYVMLDSKIEKAYLYSVSSSDSDTGGSVWLCHNIQITFRLEDPTLRHPLETLTTLQIEVGIAEERR